MPATINTSATLADELYSLASPLVKHYRTDLDIDRVWICDNPGVPFLYQVRETGTTIIGLLPIEQLPGKGEWVPYLFGTADAWHIAREAKSLAYCVTDPHSLPSLLLLHFDGRKLRRVTVEKFRQIADEYTRRMHSALLQRDRAGY